MWILRHVVHRLCLKLKNVFGACIGKFFTTWKVQKNLKNPRISRAIIRLKHKIMRLQNKRTTEPQYILEVKNTFDNKLREAQLIL